MTSASGLFNANLFFERLMERVEEAADRPGVHLQFLALRARQESQSERDLDARFELAVGAKGDAHVMRVYLRVATTVPLSDVRRNRDGRSSYLAGQSIQLVSRECGRRLVTLFDEIHGVLPRLELPISAC